MRRGPSSWPPASTLLRRPAVREIVDDCRIRVGIAAAVPSEECGHVGPGRLGVGCALQAPSEFRRLVAHGAVRGEELRTIQRGRRDIRLRAGGSGRVRPLLVAGSAACAAWTARKTAIKIRVLAAFAIGIRSFERWSGRDRSPPARIAPGELQSSSSSSVSSVLPVLASRVELDRAAVPVLRLDLVLAVLALDLVHLAVAFGLQLGEHLLHRDRRRGRRLLAGLASSADRSGQRRPGRCRGRIPPSPGGRRARPPVAWSCCSCPSPCRVKIRRSSADGDGLAGRT